MNARAEREHRGESTGLVWMLLSAALSGYFGFMLRQILSQWPQADLPHRSQEP